MLVSFLSDNLQKKLAFVSHAVSLRNQLPILSNFLLEAKEGELIISATDLEIGIVSSITAKVEKKGRTTIPAKNFLDLISNMGSQKITLELEGAVLKLKSDKVKASFQTTPAEEFPKLYEQKGKELLKTKRKEIEDVFTRTIFSAATDSSRPALSGILIDNQKEGVLLVATDRYRLSYQKTDLKTLRGSAAPIVIPARVIRETMFLKEDEDQITFFVSSESNQVLISQGETTIVGRLIDAEYPEYNKIIPTEFNTKTSFGREEMLNAIKICTVFARETANIIKISIEKNKITISANSPSVGEDAVEVGAKTTGEDNEIAFNAKYVVDVLSALTVEDMIFEMNGPLNPGVFKIEGDNSFLHLIMPIRVQG